MKRLIVTMLAALTITGAQAQTILSEDFETGNTGSSPQPVAKGAGWTVVDGYSGSNVKYKWHNYYSDPTGETGPLIQGACCAEVDAAMFTSDTEGKGPREEILLSPELNLDNTYQLKFSWQVSPVNHYDESKYDLQVRVVENGDLQGAETIFSIHNEKMLRESGVTAFPIDSWDIYTSRLDLSDWRGEKVQLAFVYKMLAPTGNLARLDDITVSQFTPATTPVASLSMDRYTFPQMYIGEKYYSDPITLTNTGADGLQITGIDYPEGFSSNIGDFSAINLLKNKSVMFNLSYTASMTSAAQGDVVFHTNGGDVKVAVNASKQFVPEGMTLETFEQYFPPAGWQQQGWGFKTLIEGDRTAYASGDYGASWLRSPRLDLSDGGKVTFTYYNYFDSENSEDAPQYDIMLQVSLDGGNTWQTKWTSDYINGLNQLLTETVDLGLGDDNCYIRWYYPAVETDDEGAYSHSIFYLDRVLLPYVYGSDGVPQAASIVSPANNSTDIYPENVKLSWTPAQFAKGYKLYLGTTKAANEVIDGQDLGNVLSYTLPKLNYSTEYRWKIVGYNDNGDCTTASTWRFTTQPDATISEFPFEENFENKGVPTGWTSRPSEQYSRTWDTNTVYPYKSDGKSYNVLSSSWLNPGDWNAVITPELKLPADKPMSVSFIWGDGHPSDLVVDPLGTVKKNNVEPNNGVSITYCDIYADGEWTTLSWISENAFDGEDAKYWIPEKIDLSAYKGKTVKLRWRHESFSTHDDGGSLVHVVVNENLDYRAHTNLSSWEAGKVNYEKGISSGEIFTLFNDGEKNLTVKSASFTTPNFSTSLKAGDVIEVGGNKAFSLRFDALQTASPVSDELLVSFDGGYELKLPVSAEALAEGIYYYSFEPNELDYVWTDDFSMIDADNQRGYSFSSGWVHYSADNAKCAFSLENDSYENGMYGMMNPVSGNYALVASAPASGSGADNWIISRKLKATSSAKFEFWARNMESNQSVLPDPKSEVTVLVSTTGNTNTSDFSVVRPKEEIPFLDYDNWQFYSVDLSQFAGQDIYVALRHTTVGEGNLAFFDDFTLHGFDGYVSGVDSIEAVADNAEVEVFDFSGVKVASGVGMSTLRGLAKGFYVVRVSDENGVRTVKIAL